MANMLDMPQSFKGVDFSHKMSSSSAKAPNDNINDISDISDIKISNASNAKKSIHKSTMDFCKLFFANLRNQDPLSPTKTKDMLPQIAQIHSVEQTMNTNVILEKILDFMGLASQASYLGKLVSYKYPTEGTVNLKDSNAVCKYEVSEATSNVYINIQTLDGHRVFSRKVECEKGWNSFVWDGKDEYGNTLEDNTYKVEIFAKTPNGKQLDINVLSTGKITGGTPKENSLFLIVDSNIEIPIKDVVEIMQEEKGHLNVDQTLKAVADLIKNVEQVNENI